MRNGGMREWDGKKEKFNNYIFYPNWPNLRWKNELDKGSKIKSIRS